MTGLLRNGSPLIGAPRLTPPPGHRRFLVLPLVALLLLGLLAVAAWHSLQGPPTSKRLSDWVLSGPRGPACLRIIVASDVSGSMASYASARDHALAEVFDWAKSNLRVDDQIAVVDFAADAGVQLPPQPARTSSSLGGIPSTVHDGTFTLLDPLLKVVASLPPTTCDNELILISDAQLADLPSGAGAGNHALTSHRTHDIRLLVPGFGIKVWNGWSNAFPEAKPTRFDGKDPDATALTFGRMIAELTKQQLHLRHRP